MIPLEQAITNQTAAIIANTQRMEQLIALFANGIPAIATPQPPAVTTQPVDVPKTTRTKKAAETPVKTEAAEAVQEQPAPSIFDKTAEEPAVQAEPVTREMITRAVLDLVKINRQAAVDVLGKYGVNNAKLLTDAQLPAAYADLQAAFKAGA